MTRCSVCSQIDQHAMDCPVPGPHAPASWAYWQYLHTNESGHLAHGWWTWLWYRLTQEPVIADLIDAVSTSTPKETR